MLLLIPGAISNSNAVIRQEFRKLRFQMIDDSGRRDQPFAGEVQGCTGIAVWSQRKRTELNDATISSDFEASKTCCCRDWLVGGTR